MSNNNANNNQGDDTFQGVFDLNNEGVILLSSGDIDDIRGSATAFQRALAILSTRVAEDDDEEQQGEEVFAAERALPSQHRLEISPSPMGLPNLQAWEFYVFSHPLMMMPPQDQNDDDHHHHPAGTSRDLLPLYTGVILFNLALLIHERNMLPRAMSLYARCLEVLDAFCVTTATTAGTRTSSSWWTCPTAQVLSLVVLNNMAEVYWRLGHVEQAQDCMRDFSYIRATPLEPPLPPKQEEQQEHDSEGGNSSSLCSSSSSAGSASSSSSSPTVSGVGTPRLMAMATSTLASREVDEYMCRNSLTIQLCSNVSAPAA